MDFATRPLLAAAFIGSLVLSACRETSPSTEVAGAESGKENETPANREPLAPGEEKAGFTVWMSRAELTFRRSQLAQGQAFFEVEGRQHRGENQYRALIGDLSATEFDDIASFWGFTEAQLFPQELFRLERGYLSGRRQVFTDSTGQAIYQLVMPRPKGSQPVRPSRPAALAPAAPPAPDPQPVVEEVAASAGVSAIDAPAGEFVPLPLPANPDPEIATTSTRETNESQPPTEIAVAPAAQAVEESPITEAAQAAPAPVIHRVVKGDTLSRIAKRYRTTVVALKKTNALRSDNIRIGQKLKIPR